MRRGAACGLLLLGMAGAAGAQSLADALTRARTVKGEYVSWREHRIDDEQLSGLPIRGSDGLAIRDIDRDGFLDVVSVHEDSSHVRIAFGTGDPDRWHSYTLAQAPLVKAPEDVDLGDLNRDGRLDVVVACEDGHLVYFEAPAHPRVMTSWKPTVPFATLRRGSWIRVKMADMDRDGRREVVAANKGGTSFSSFSIEGEPSDPNAWKEQVIGRARQPINVRPIDLDRDGDEDLLAASRGERKVVLYENLGAGKGYRERLVWGGTPACEGFMMQIVDLNRDRRPDILTEQEHGGAVFWLEQPPSLEAEWVFHRIGSIGPDHATGLGLADLTGDGKLDLMVGGYSGGSRREDPAVISPAERCGRLAWFEQPADPAALWTRHDVSRRRRGMYEQGWTGRLRRDPRQQRRERRRALAGAGAHPRAGAQLLRRTEDRQPGSAAAALTGGAAIVGHRPVAV
jgi:hypothetical protein